MKKTMMGLIVLAAGLALNAPAANQYWDPSSVAGYQHGDGVWSTDAGDANWTLAGGAAPLSPFGNTNDAQFNAWGGASTVTVNGSLTTGVAYVNGSAYSIVITNGGRIYSWTVALGNANASNSNRVTVAGGAGVTSSWVTGNMRVGGTATMATTNNVIVVDGRGIPESAVMSNVSLTVGASGGNAGNEMQVIGGGRLMTAGATIGSLSTGNAVRVQGAGSQWSAGGLAVTVGTGAGARCNTLAIEDEGVVTNAAVVTVGTVAGSGLNLLRIAGGGRLYSSGTAVIGLTASPSNSVLVSGTGSLWQVSQLTLGSGSGSSGNVLRVENGGVVRCLTGRIWLGESASCNSNQLIIRDGQVYALAVALGNNQYGQSVSILGGEGLNSLLDCQGSTFGMSGTTVFGGHSALIDAMGFDGSAVASNISTVTIGAGGGLCSLVVTNRGRLYAGSALVVSGGTGSTAAVVQGSRVNAGGLQISGSGNALTVADPDSLLVLAGSNSIIGTAAFQTGNTVRVTSGGVITNGGTFGVGSFNTNIAGALAIGLTGKVFTTGSAFLGTGIGSTGNTVTVDGEGSLWDLGGRNLVIGTNNALTVSNGLAIVQGGAVDNVGALTVHTNNQVSLSGGSLGVASAVYNNGGAFAVGDGAQAAVLKSLAAGTLTFTAGLLVSSNAVLSGGGTMSGTGAGVEIAGGGTLSPGLDGIGYCRIGGSNLAFDAGAIYRCEIADMNAGPGAGWDWVNVSSQLVLSAAGAVIKLDSRGTTPANWSAGSDYNLRVLNYGSLAGAVTNVTVDASGFTPGGTWTVTNANNALYVLYRGSGISYSPTSKWNDPNNGNWTVTGNWTPNGQPANDGTAALEFGGSGPGYASTNDAGAFMLNKLLLTGTGGSGVTNVIAGSTLVFTNAEARVDYSGSACYQVLCTLTFRTNVVVDGNGYGSGMTDLPLVTLTNITAAGGLTKKGPWMMALAGANTFGGPLVLDSAPDGVLKVATNSIGANNNLVVSNGILWMVGNGNAFARKGVTNRKGLITGPNSVWTNTASSFNVAEGTTTETTNNVLTVADGATLYCGSGNFLVGSSCPRNSLVISNGGRVFSAGGGVGGSSNGGNNTLLVTGSNSLWSGGSITIGAGSGGNVLRVEQGGMFAGGSITVQNLGSSPSFLLVTNGGIVTCTGLQLQNDLAGSSSRGLAIVTGPGSLLRFGGGASALLRRTGSQGSTLTVSDGGTVTNVSWTVSGTEAGIGTNGIIVTGGGRMFCTGTSSVVTTNNCRDNFFQVSGANSLWNNGGGGLNLVNGGGAPSIRNYVKLSDGAMMTNVGTLNLATINASTSSNNYVLVDGGVLQAATLTCNNGQPNWATLTGTGVLSLGSLILTNAGQTVTVSGGALTLKNALVSNGVEQAVGDGSQISSLTLLPGGTNIFANGLAISTNATLGGSGTIAATTTVYGALSPGHARVGALANQGAFTLAGGSASRFDVVTNTSAGSGWDVLVVTSGTLALGGQLTPVLAEGYIPAKTDRFLIMTNQSGSVAGGFSNGGQATAYDEDLKTKRGSFDVEVAAQSVVLTGYREWRSGSTVIVIY